MSRRWRDLERIEVRPPGGRRQPPGDDLSEVAAAWTDAVGAPVAQRATPARLRRGELVVACESSVWAAELSLLSGRIMAGLRAAMGERAPARVRFEVGELPAPAPLRRSPPRPASSPDPALASRAAELSAAVHDPELREAVERALHAAMQAGRGPG